MKTSTLLYRALDFGGKKSPNLKQKKEAYVEYAWRGIEEWKFPELKELLTPLEYFAFLPVQRLSREQDVAHRFIKTHGEVEFVKRCVEYGMRKLEFYNPVFHYIEHEKEKSRNLFYQLSLQERLGGSIYEDDTWILKQPPARILTTKEMKAHDAEMIIQRISALEQIRRGELVVEGKLNEKGRVPPIAKKLWKIARLYDDIKSKDTEITEYEDETIQHQPRPHLSTDNMLRTYKDWEIMFKTKDRHNTTLAKFLIHSFVDLEKSRSRALNLVENMPFSMIVPLYASTQFFKEMIPSMFEETVQYSSQDFVNFHVQENPYTNYFLKPFRDLTHKSAYKREEIAMDPERELPKVNPRWFVTPRQRIMSEHKAKRYELEHEVTIVPFYPTRSIPELEEKLEKEGKKTKKSVAVTEKDMFFIRRRMVNGVREYIRDALQVRMNEKTKHKKPLLEDRLL